VRALAEHVAEHPRPELLFQPDRGPREQALADRVQVGHHHQRGEGEREQHHQRLDAAARDHAVVDLEHEQRRRQHQHVDHQAERRRGEEVGPELGEECAHEFASENRQIKSLRHFRAAPTPSDDASRPSVGLRAQSTRPRPSREA
jgi:hypothetical protein